MIIPQHISHKRGFTLIELLIVVGILGILAAGLLAAIDPLEQLKKGRDTTKRNIAVEYHNALTRFFAVQGEFPWGQGNTLAVTTLNDMDTAGYTQTLINSGELKSSFNQGLPGNAGDQITVANPVADADIFVCFQPESKAVRGDPSTIFSDTSGTIDTTNCPDATGATTCYWCAR